MGKIPRKILSNKIKGYIVIKNWGVFPFEDEQDKEILKRLGKEYLENEGTKYMARKNNFPILNIRLARVVDKSLGDSLGDDLLDILRDHILENLPYLEEKIIKDLKKLREKSEKDIISIKVEDI